MVKPLRLFLSSVVLFAACWTQSSAQQPSTNEVPQPTAKEVAQPAADGTQPIAKAAAHPATEEIEQPARLHLTTVDTILAKSEIATGFAGLTCDDDGNLYLGLDRAGTGAIRKINARGELVALFKPEANPDIQVLGVGSYYVTPDGELYVWVGSKTEITRYVLVFKSDGSYKSNIKLEPGFAWAPASISAFPNGNLLMTGQKLDRNSKLFIVPFTGIFRSDGKLLKEITPEQDERLPDTSPMRNLQPGQPVPLISNRAVSWGQMETAKDGNIYIMRWASPAAFYAVSPGGEVVKRFTVDPGTPGYEPLQMHISGNRIAVLFRQPQTNDTIMKIVDLEGQELATYDERRVEGKPHSLGLAFACYTMRPERFTFLSTGPSYRIELKLVEAR